MGGYDLIIQGGRVIDGRGHPPVAADLGLRRDRIAAIGDLGREEATARLPARGLLITPGFIDMHSHSDFRLWDNRRAESKIRQGVTTEVVGNCGFSPAPLTPEFTAELQSFAGFLARGLDWDWRSLADFLRRFEAEGSSVNLIQLVGHGTLRIAAMGFARRPPTARELVRMERLVSESLEAGAWGLSSGLIYAPGCYAETEELIALARIVRESEGLYTSHIRGEGANLLHSVAEAIRIGREGGVSVEVSHIKAAGRPNWGNVPKALALMDAARGDGLDVTADVYPYLASATTLSALLPPWALESGIDAMADRLGNPAVRIRIAAEVASGLPGWENPAKNAGWEGIMIAACPGRPDVEGRCLDELAQEADQPPVEVAMDLLQSQRGRVAMILFQLDESDLRAALAHPHVMIGSDGSALAPGGATGAEKVHPRSYGTFPRVLGRYARDEKVLSMEEAIRKMTSLPAQKLGLRDRGMIAPGAKADLVCFDPEGVSDRATYTEPHQYPAGIHHVIVNGTVVIQGGEHTGALPGQVLRRGAG